MDSVVSSASALRPSGRAGPQTPICICCFGRGGSSLLWHFLGSSPDVWMMQHEWHRAFYRSFDPARKALRRITRKGHLPEPGTRDWFVHRALRRKIRQRIIDDLRPSGPLHHVHAEAIAIKLMDHNIVWRKAILQAFDGGETVLLTRGPVPQCESLMRSGLSLEDACQWYNDVAAHMIRVAEDGSTISIRFDQLVQDPVAVFQHLYRDLGIAAPHTYYAKAKPYGSDRVKITNVSGHEITPIQPDDVRGFIDPSVETAAFDRLSSSEVDKIRSATASAAAKLGYS